MTLTSVQLEALGRQALVFMLDALTNDLTDHEPFWGVAFPRCPGHHHPADYAAEGADVVLTCPTSGTELSRTQVKL